jgi:hypothetical protein
MKEIFEVYFGKRPSRSTTSNATPLVDLSIDDVKASQDAFAATEHSSATPKGNGGLGWFHTVPPSERYHNSPSHSPMPHINNMGIPTKIDRDFYFRALGSFVVLSFP